MDQVSIGGLAQPVAALAYGGGSLGTSLSGDDARRHIAAYLDAGGNFFDTAHCYACWIPGKVGASEVELGRVLRELGAQGCVVATKGGHPAFGAEYPRPEHFLAPDVLARDIDESRERLQMDSLDLFYLHRDDGVTPVSEILDFLNGQIDAGAIRAIGASNWSADRLDDANQWARKHGKRPFAVSQLQGSLPTPTWSPTAEPTTRFLDDDALALSARTNLPIVCYSATAGGYLAGNPGADGLYHTPENDARRTRAQTLAARLGATPTQIGLAYLRAIPGVTTLPLFGTTSLSHLHEILGASRFALTADEARWLRDGDPVDAEAES